MTVESTAFRNAVFLFSFALLLLKTSHLINKLNTVMIKKTKTNNIFMFVVFCLQIRLQIMSKKEEEDPCSVQLHSPCVVFVVPLFCLPKIIWMHFKDSFGNITYGLPLSIAV